jgi:uncharacterized repeat protein (TIGR03803 family)
VLHAFGVAAGDGTQPNAGLIQGTDGNFYGTTNYGGSSVTNSFVGYGTVFKMTPTGLETVLHSFGVTAGDGTNPVADLIQGTDGNLYGTTSTGGTHSGGTVFKMTLVGAETVLYSFGAAGDGTNPVAGLVQGTDGNFYGTTQNGGTLNKGTVFKMTPAGLETVFYSFGTAGDGAYPVANLIQGTDGNFYGTTSAGGTHSGGTVFKMTLAGAETVLYSFGTVGDGMAPVAGLIQGTDGNFYGTTIGTSNGGGYSVGKGGTVFKITSTGTETVLYSFGGSGDGANPRASLIQAIDGNFYGTNDGGTGLETVFKITSTGTETVLYSFNNVSYGVFPVSRLLQGTGGNLYGTTNGGGTAGGGTVFTIAP